MSGEKQLKLNLFIAPTLKKSRSSYVLKSSITLMSKMKPDNFTLEVISELICTIGIKKILV